MDGGISAFILAGGKSTRLGTDKALVMLEGRTLLSSVLSVARELTPQVQIVGDPAKYEKFAPVIQDVFPGCGPLAGIHAALRASQTDLNVILAVDIPLVSAALLEFILMRARNSAATVTLPHADGRFQPLCAIYRRAFADMAEKALLVGRNKIDPLFNEASTLVICEEELQVAGFTSDSFRNLNTAEDLAAARIVTDWNDA